ncbi:class I adenylate-forming enzyme family protein [Acidocella sp.]|uniref:class I adenylate-forming enzyme family protein n=1 Tax=Acidocella sp. TaxID=50710 RepID=UPI002617DD3D|nr:AMP-binding protein [Acidocella sp.]
MDNITLTDTDRFALEKNLATRVNVGDMLTRSAARDPHKTALVQGERRLSYREFNDYANRLANALLARGYRPGDALGLMCGNCIEFLAVYYACAKIGVICTPINLFWRRGEISYVFNHARVRGIAVQERWLDELGHALPDIPLARDIIVIEEGRGARLDLPAHCEALSFARLCAAADSSNPEVLVEDRAPLSYLYTSGTTSAPKGVVGNHLAIYVQTLNVIIDIQLTANDRLAAMMPMFHTAQLNGFCTTAIANNATIYILEAFEPKALLDLIDAEKISLMFALPMMYRAMMEEQLRAPRNVSSMRRMIYAMAPMPDDDVRKLMDMFKCELSLLFGQTEMSPASTCFRPEHQLTHPGAIGHPMINVEVGIVDENDQLLPWGQTGEIVYRSPHLLTEYLRDEEATRKGFRKGWFHSGDVGHFDETGMLWFDDRSKDVIKSGGENVASIEVEKALYAIEPKLLEVVVVGVPHERWGEAITAVATVREGETVDPEDVLARLRSKLSPFKCPKALILVDAMPRTATGKVQKNEVRKNYADYFRA